MRAEAISPHDISMIIRELSARGVWEGTRGGWRIRLIRFPVTRDPVTGAPLLNKPVQRQRIEYALRAPGGRDWKSGEATTVYDALQACRITITVTPKAVSSVEAQLPLFAEQG